MATVFLPHEALKPAGKTADDKRMAFNPPFRWRLPPAKCDAGKMQTKQIIRSARGFTLVEIMIVVAILTILASLAVPGLMRARATSQANLCISNMRELENAVNQMALERGLATGTAWNFPNDILPYLKKMPLCPAGGTYAEGAIGATVPTCSIGNTVNPGHILP